jgi:translation elongation factor EF-G
LNRYCLGRVMSGTLKKGQTVRVLGEAYSPDDEVGPVQVMNSVLTHSLKAPGHNP